MSGWPTEPVYDPLPLFDQWLAEAAASEPNDPNAAALATCTPSGIPSVRMVLAKRIHDPEAAPANPDQRFCIFTNIESRKGQEILLNPRAALCFHWKSLRRQFRVEGQLSPLSDAASDAYFHSRSRGSQIGAAASNQSRPLANRELLEDRAAAFAHAHPGEIPRPGFWRGFYLTPERIEFWVDGKDRLHDRLLFLRNGESWLQTRLYP
jgi:pyridoxamine 5'-phosphate oxidase